MGDQLRLASENVSGMRPCMLARAWAACATSCHAMPCNAIAACLHWRSLVCMQPLQPLPYAACGVAAALCVDNHGCQVGGRNCGEPRCWHVLWVGERGPTCFGLHLPRPLNHTQGENFNDKLGADGSKAKPDMIVADIYATAQILRVAASVPADHPLHASKMVLYFDEPNMGIDLDAGVQAAVQEVMRHAPATTVLASATLPTSWGVLDPWWQPVPAHREVITQEPYQLPIARLAVFDASHTPLQVKYHSPFDLFKSFADFRTYIGDMRRRVLLLRHLTTEQAQELASKDKAEVDAAELCTTMGKVRACAPACLHYGVVVGGMGGAVRGRRAIALMSQLDEAS